MKNDRDPGRAVSEGAHAAPSFVEGEELKGVAGFLTRFWRSEDSLGLQLWRAKVLTAVLWAIALLGLIAYLPSVALAVDHGLLAVVVVDTVGLLAVFVLAAARRVPYGPRAVGLLAVCFSIGVYFTWSFGPIAAGPLWLLATPVLAALLFGLPGAAVSLALTTASLIGFGVLLQVGLVTWGDAVTMPVWVIVSSNFLCLSALLALSIAVLLSGVVELHRRFEREIEARKQADLQVEQASKLEAIGRLAGGVAHDFNNILTAIFGYVEMVRSEVGDRADLAEHLDGIDASAHRAANMTRHLLAFSRHQDVHLSEVDVGALLAAMASMLRRLIREDIRFDIEVEDGGWAVLGDPAQLEQIILNLVVNAVDAIRGSGTIEVRVGGRRASQDEAAAVGVPAGDYVEISVADDGRGMTEVVRSRIFEPFFTTKAPGEGTGLGLATVHGIVVKSGGAVVVDSSIGCGTTFTVFLPRVADGRTDGPGVGDQPEGTGGGGEVVLVVDDNGAIRDLVDRSLSGLGYRVYTADGYREALALANQLGPEIRLLLTDVIMPETSGPALARGLASRLPNACVLYMSGYTADILDQHGVRDSAATVLHKPFTLAELADRVRRVLDGGQRRAG